MAGGKWGEGGGIMENQRKRGGQEGSCWGRAESRGRVGRRGGMGRGDYKMMSFEPSDSAAFKGTNPWTFRLISQQKTCCFLFHLNLLESDLCP